MINDWRDELVSAADLQTTDLERLHSARVYKHHQFQSAPGLILHDDHHSPIKTDTYIELRLEAMMRFYQERLPVYTQRRFMLRLLLLFCTTAAAVLAYLDLAPFVICFWQAHSPLPVKAAKPCGESY